MYSSVARGVFTGPCDPRQDVASLPRPHPAAAPCALCLPVGRFQLCHGRAVLQHRPPCRPLPPGVSLQFLCTVARVSLHCCHSWVALRRVAAAPVTSPAPHRHSSPLPGSYEEPCTRPSMDSYLHLSRTWGSSCRVSWEFHV